MHQRLDHGDASFQRARRPPWLAERVSRVPCPPEQLRLAEIELRMQRKRVAELRRQLPKGAHAADYAFIEGPGDLNAGDTPTRTLRLSELFTAPTRALVGCDSHTARERTGQ